MTVAVYNTVGVFLGLAGQLVEQLPAPLGADEQAHWPKLEGDILGRRQTDPRRNTKVTKFDRSSLTVCKIIRHP